MVVFPFLILCKDALDCRLYEVETLRVTMFVVNEYDLFDSQILKNMKIRDGLSARMGA